MIKKWLRARRWKNGLYAAFLRYNQLEQFDKSVRIAKRLGDDELIQLAVTCRFMQGLVDALCAGPTTDQTVNGTEITDIPGRGVFFCDITEKEFVDEVWWGRALFDAKSIHVYYCPTQDQWCAPEFAEIGIKKVRLTY